MSVVWAFVNEDKGYVFSDGRSVDNDDKIYSEDTDKTFKVETEDRKFIGGLTGALIINTGSKPTSPDLYMKDQMVRILKDNKSTDDISFKNDISNALNLFTSTNYGKGSTHFLIITPWQSLFKISIMYNLKSLDVNSLSYKNESIGDGGDEGSYNSRTIFFNGIYCFKNTNFKDYKNLFRLVKRQICGNTVGGKTFHQTLP